MKMLRKVTDFHPYSSLTKRRKRPETGRSPGSIIYKGKIHTDKIRIEVIDYTPDEIQEVNILDPAELEQYKHNKSVTWVNIQGLHDVSLIGKIGEILGLHPLTMEDVVDMAQRPKIEEFDDYMYVTLKMINYNPNLRKVDIEQAGIIIHQNYVICFQERPGDVFDDIRRRLRDSQGRARKRGADYLAYMMLDLIIDYYYETLDEVWNKVEHLEELVIRSPQRIELREIQLLKKDLLQLRRYIYPVKDAIHALVNRESGIFRENTLAYMRDSYDHIQQVVDNINTYREVLSNTMDIYLSQLSIKMNEVMKVLTLIATIFIPLTFVAGIYGMNFDHMPELSWPWAYPTGFYLLTGLITFIMVIYMKSKKWF